MLDMLRICNTYCFSSGCANASRCYVMRTLIVLYIFMCLCCYYSRRSIIYLRKFAKKIARKSSLWRILLGRRDKIGEKNGYRLGPGLNLISGTVLKNSGGLVTLLYSEIFTVYVYKRLQARERVWVYSILPTETLCLTLFRNLYHWLQFRRWFLFHESFTTQLLLCLSYMTTFMFVTYILLWVQGRLFSLVCFSLLFCG